MSLQCFQHYAALGCVLPPGPAMYIVLQIVSSSYTAAAYLASIGFGTKVQPGKSVLLLGSEGMAEELLAAGFEVIDVNALQLPAMNTVEAMLNMQASHLECGQMPGALCMAEVARSMCSSTTSCTSIGVCQLVWQQHCLLIPNYISCKHSCIHDFKSAPVCCSLASPYGACAFL
jgi:hypothetical protein